MLVGFRLSFFVRFRLFFLGIHRYFSLFLLLVFAQLCLVEPAVAYRLAKPGVALLKRVSAFPQPCFESLPPCRLPLFELLPQGGLAGPKRVLLFPQPFARLFPFSDRRVPPEKRCPLLRQL